MRLTNNFGLPDPIYQAVKNDPYKRVGTISVTALIRSPRMVQLERRHDEDVTEDATDRIWSLIGSAVHSILERAALPNALSEERLIHSLLGWEISGQPDLLDHEHTLTDYKIVGVMSVLNGAKQEWVEQLQLYAWLYRKSGFEVQRAQLVAIFRDWTRSRAERESDYPQTPVMVLNVPLWPAEEQEAFVAKRVLFHQAAELLADDALPECTPEERWQRDDSWAVKKPANKKAYRVFDNEAAALALAEEKKDMAVEFRPGASVRCQSYCRALPWCNIGKKLVEKASPAEVEEAAA